MQTEISTIISYGQIYRLTNKINGKMYHGQTTEEDINDRWKYYKKLQCKNQPKIYNALKKYGSENFLFEVVDTTPQNQEQLDNLEISYIAKFDSMNNGYNCDPGGKSGKHSEETKIKISNAHKGENNFMFGKKHSKETKRKISEAQRGEKGPMFGKHFSEDIKHKLSINRKGNLNPMFGRKLSEESKNKISKIKLGHVVSDETRLKISQGNTGARNHMFGKFHSEESKRKMKKAHKNKIKIG